jgi:hypothetical protein
MAPGDACRPPGLNGQAAAGADGRSNARNDSIPPQKCNRAQLEQQLRLGDWLRVKVARHGAQPRGPRGGAP